MGIFLKSLFLVLPWLFCHCFVFFFWRIVLIGMIVHIRHKHLQKLPRESGTNSQNISDQILYSVTLVSNCANCDQLLLSVFFWFVFLSTVKVQYKLPCSQAGSSCENDLIDIILASKAKILHYGIEPCIVPQQFFFFSSYAVDFWWHGEEGFAFEASEIAHREWRNSRKYTRHAIQRLLCLHLPVCLVSKQWSAVELGSVGN